DSEGCTYASAQVRWTAATSVDLQQGGADRVELRYRDVLPNQPSAVSFGLKAVDVNGLQAGAYGLTRNGGAAGDFLTIRYVPAYVGDVAVFSFPPGFDKGHVKSITLYVTATAGNQSVSVTFQGIGTNVGEPAYEAPSIDGPDSYAFAPSTTTTHTFTVAGNPTPDVTVTGRPAWMSATTSPTAGGTLVTLSGNPGTAYSDTSIHVHADVASSLTADRDLRIVVPSPVTLSSTSSTTRVGTAGPLTLGTATSTPASGIVGTPSGLPAGTSLGMSGTSIVLNGTPTVAGDYTITSTVGNAWATAPFTRTLTVGQVPEVSSAATSAVLVRGEAMAPITLTVTGYPAPTLSATGLPSGLTLSPAGVISGTPTVNGSASVGVTAINGFGTFTAQLTLQVGDRPGVTPPSQGHVVAGTAADLAVATSGTPDTVTATGLPAGLSLSQVSGDWVVSGTPTRPASSATASGVATITATSIYGTSQATWSWNVDAAPLLAGPTSVSTTVGTALSGAELTATGFPAPTLTVTDTSGDPVSLPAGLSVDASTPGTVRIVGTPTASGTVVVRVTASNGIGTDAVHELTVRALRAPSFADANPALTVEAGESASLTLQWSGHELPTLSTTATLPAWLDLDLATGVVTATPPAGVSGPFGPYAVVATNSTASATAQLTVVVDTPAVISSLSDETLQQGIALGATQVGTYAGYPAPTLTVDGVPAGLALVGSNGQLILSGTPTAPGGEYQVTVEADNGIGAPASEVLTITVTVPATLSGPADASFPVGLPASVALTATGYPAPVLSATGLPAGMALSQAGLVSGIPTVPGTYTVTVGASNGVGAAPTPVDIEITVREAPVVTLDASNVHPGDTVEVTASGFLPGEPVRIELHSTPVLLATLTASAAGVVSGSITIPRDTAPGSHSVVALAASGAQGSAPVTVTAAASLSATGADAAGGAWIALALLAAGAALVLARGMRSRASS
ncbi:MAG: putative Ig domain-containing protein, partial [Protaetiibacter sp.]